MASISVCMIVKNEEAVLARCLDSLDGIPDEIIVVDTGSTDRTKEIARQYTDKVYDFAWTGDFAAARNASLAKASCDYVYVADADEVIDEENRQRFAQLKAALLPEVEVVEVVYRHCNEHTTTSNFEVEHRPKLFRRLRAFVYVDPVHEVLRTDPVVFRSNVEVQHRPTSDHSGRDLAQLARLVEKGEALSPRLEMMYARELMLGGTAEDFRAAKRYFETVRTDPLRPSDAARRAACVLAACASIEKDVKGLLQFAAPELVGTPPAEICCALGDYYYATGDEQQAADWFAAALSGAEPEMVAASAGRIPMEGLAACFEKAGDTEQAKQYRKQAAAWRPEDLLQQP